jgi:hypothetical protein
MHSFLGFVFALQESPEYSGDFYDSAKKNTQIVSWLLYMLKYIEGTLIRIVITSTYRLNSPPPISGSDVWSFLISAMFRLALSPTQLLTQWIPENVFPA